MEMYNKYCEYLDMEWIEQLLIKIGINQGFMGTNRYYDNVDHSKIKGNGKPGSKVTIEWTEEFEGITDEGYIFTLPGLDSDDIYMSGIVHIPYPNGPGKGKEDPYWETMHELSVNNKVKHILIQEG